MVLEPEGPSEQEPDLGVSSLEIMQFQHQVGEIGGPEDGANLPDLRAPSKVQLGLPDGTCTSCHKPFDDHKNLKDCP